MSTSGRFDERISMAGGDNSYEDNWLESDFWLLVNSEVSFVDISTILEAS
ncbi:unnamed protein product [Schistosoma curassoni]|uniref:CK II beta n=1 Tax=Schistosoma curassoni TaxID=6186 RepID=A0A183JED4_9TREM|nr:unnamed protein product [Schistosoma curassoni]